MTAGAGSGSGGRREAGDFESRPEKETTTQPEKVGERAPSMPAPGSDGDWDSLKDVPMGSAYNNTGQGK